MTKRVRSMSVLVGAGLAWALAAPAAAHIVLAEPQAAAGSYYAGHFRVGHGCDGSPTVKLRVALPSGIVTARAQPKPGWTVSVEREALAQPVRIEGHETSERVAAISWSGRLDADQFDDFGILMKLPEAAGALYFPTVQSCETGAKAWTDIPAPGQAWHDVASPAPVLQLVADTPSEPQKVTVGTLSVEGATIYETPGGNGAAYLTLSNAGTESDTITAVSADVATSAEFHTMSNGGGTMQMRPLGEVVVPAGGTVAFKSGGDHIMLIGLTKPLKAGDTVTLTLSSQHNGAVTVPVVVTPRAAGGGHSGHH